jgi:very-short-patch-repair endonuclease
MAGIKFRRQEEIDGFIVDFICYEKKLVIELDGGQHADMQDEDRKRDNYLMKNGFRVLRVWNTEIMKNMEGVLEGIRGICLDNGENSPSPIPSPAGGEGVKARIGEGKEGKSRWRYV